MLILDTSAILNIVGTGNPRLVLSHLSLQVFLPEEVLREVKREPQVAKGSSLVDLLKDGCVSVIKCTSEMNDLAIELAGAPAPDDLDDGESYAISCTVLAGAMIGIDDRKGRRVLRERWPQVVQHFTIDLIAQAAKQASLTAEQHAELVYLALKNTRMRVPKDRRVDVVELIGRDKARECPSLGMIP